MPVRCGTAATEFMIVLPMMLLIGLGCIDLGRAVRYYGVMSNAASAGSQSAATCRFYEPYTRAAWEKKVRAAVRDELRSLAGGDRSSFDVRIETVLPPREDEGDDMLSLPRITVAIDYDFLPIFHWPGLARKIPLHCESVIRQFR